MSIDNSNFVNTIKEQDENEKSYKELYGIIEEKTFLGICIHCDADVFAHQPHVEVTTVYVFEDKTARTDTNYSHMMCHKFDVR